MAATDRDTDHPTDRGSPKDRTDQTVRTDLTGPYGRQGAGLILASQDHRLRLIPYTDLRQAEGAVGVKSALGFNQLCYHS